MVPPTGDGGSPAPIDRPILEFHQTRLRATQQVEQATITDASGHLELHIVLDLAYYPASVDDAQLTIRWYTNDDFKIHYREVHPDHTWGCRWDRHPNPHNNRDHFHPPPAAPTPGDDASWPTDHRDVLTLVLDEIEDRIATLWGE
ncbi:MULTISPECIES: hypothetical protein [Halolamina]|uniref:Uncharacterized protein n=1 Tax=Halolamina pelagica TaxID=699431 RepID=A0A1I5UNB4_9EURY|nr:MULTISPECIES: hypothetical protein [Halolamina]NHX37592.1 hypothetical protein [Halolamina sp. R1-12]SFP96086.1 hypothetical protein SAMN05216277_11329 [Halolamina pelagica]